MRRLASRAGIHLIEESSDPNAEKNSRSSGRLKDIHREVTAFLAAGFDAAQYELLVNSIGAERQAARRASLGT